MNFPHECTERNLWKQPLPTYNLDHVTSKFNLIQNPDSAKDQNVFESVSALTEELNKQEILLISTPMWNLTVPYIVKQYIDIVVQPGLTFRRKYVQRIPFTQSQGFVSCLLGISCWNLFLSLLLQYSVGQLHHKPTSRCICQENVITLILRAWIRL